MKTYPVSTSFFFVVVNSRFIPATLVTSLDLGWDLLWNTKCVSQTHKTWFYYDYTTNTTNTNNKQTAQGILSFDEAISAGKKYAKDVFAVVFLPYSVRVFLRVEGKKNTQIRDEIWFQLFWGRNIELLLHTHYEFAFSATWFPETKVIIN